MEKLIKVELLNGDDSSFKAKAMKKDPKVIYDVLNKIDLKEKNQLTLGIQKLFMIIQNASPMASEYVLPHL